MKRILNLSFVVLIPVLLCVMMCMTSCEGAQQSGNAPQSVAGKKMVIYNEGWDIRTILFTSNTSASSIKYHGGESMSFKSIEYKKTGPHSATLIIKNADYDVPGSQRDDNFPLIFISPNQGTASADATLTFDLF